MFAAKWRWLGFWHSFSFLAWDLSMQPMTRIWIFNQFICIRACACSSNLNYAHKCIENSINVQKCTNELWKISKINTTIMLFYVDTRKKMKSRRGNGYHFVQKGETIPTETINLLWEALVYEKLIPKPTPNWTKKLPRHIDAAPW